MLPVLNYFSHQIGTSSADATAAVTQLVTLSAGGDMIPFVIAGTSGCIEFASF